MKTLNHGGLSGGKDSTALMLWMVFESGYPRESLRFTWADTGNEHEYAHKYIAYLSERIYPIATIVPDMGFYQLAQKKHCFPSNSRRWCTSELKLKPAKRYLESLKAQGFEVLMHTGVRAAESPDRARMPEREWDDYFECDVYRPMLGKSIEEVFALHEKYGIAPNPLYGLTRTLPWDGSPNPFYGDGVGRFGCWPCIYTKREELGAMARCDPARVDWVAAQEESVEQVDGDRVSTLFHRSKVPLRYRSKIITTDRGEQMAVATIRDVAAWAKERTVKQFSLPMLEEAMKDEPSSCASKWGLCE